jgi:alpha-amylase
MVSFANNTNAQFRVTNYWDNGNNQMAWGRGGLGFIAINREDSASLNRTFATGMAAGTYCDIIHADFNYSTGACSGTSITVDASGNATFPVGTHDAVAFHTGAVVGVPCPACGGTTSSSSSSSVVATSSSSSSSSTSIDSWYFRGTPNNWGSTTMALSSGLYCTQQSFGDASTNPRFKIDHFANWTESYPSSDYIVSANTTYNICFNASSHAITLTTINTSASSSLASSSAVSSSSKSSSVATSSSVASSSSNSASGNVTVNFTCNNGTTYSGQSVYVSGSATGLGNWVVASSVKLNSTNYPTWTGSIQLPANTSIQWKCLKREEVNSANGNVWQGGNNNVVNTSSGNSVSASF